MVLILAQGLPEDPLYYLQLPKHPALICIRRVLQIRMTFSWIRIDQALTVTVFLNFRA